MRNWIATAEADEPGAGAVQAELAERAFDVVVLVASIGESIGREDGTVQVCFSSQQWRPITLLEAAVRGNIPAGLGGGDLRVTAQEMSCTPAGVHDLFLSLGEWPGV
jgi:hypothetical protein